MLTTRYMTCSSRSQILHIISLACLLPTLSFADNSEKKPAPNHQYSSEELFDLDLRTLISLPITVAARSEKTVARTAGAATVITHEQIQQSGMLTLPDILRMVPGLHVGRVDTQKFFVSIRGFPGRFNNKLQVMIDGRELYNPLFSGTYWEQQLPFIEDIERIEVIRGSGGSLWGSNSMSGVINVVTRDSRYTSNGLASIAIGDEELRSRSAVRQGWQSGKFSGRVYGQDFFHDDGQLTDNTQVASTSTKNTRIRPGNAADDQWRNHMAGFRMDWQFEQPNHALTLQGESYDTHADQMRVETNRTSTTPDKLFSDGHHVLVNYLLPLSDKQRLSFAGYFDEYDRRDGSFAEQRKTYNGTLQYDLNWAEHELTLGWEQEKSADETRQVRTIFLVPAEKTLDNTGLFAQNTFNFLDDRLAFTAGARFDENEYTEWENQPSAKLYYEVTPDHHVWTSWSQSVTTPGRFNTEAYVLAPQPIGPTLLGNINYKPEKMTSQEAGYRFTTADLDIDLSVYSNKYWNENRAQYATGTQPRMEGIEIALRKTWTPEITSTVQYSYENVEGPIHTPPTLTAPNGGPTELNAPAQLFSIQTNWKMTDKLSSNFALYHNTNPQVVLDNNIFQSNTRMDINLQYQAHPQLRLILAGQNLLEDAESQVYDSTRLNSGVERAVYLKADFLWQ